MDDSYSFGVSVRRRRRALDLTQAALARLVGVATITIQKIESDERRPSRQTAERLALVLAVSADEQAAFLRWARAGAEPSVPISASLARLPANLSGQALHGYQFQELIGGGGFGQVYRAAQPQLGRDVAIKVIQPAYADHPEFIRRFAAEAQFVARLEHPHIVPLYDYWRDPGGAYLVMRYVRGGTLLQRLQRKPLPLAFVLRLIDQVGAALITAHRAGVVHRDLKPANILLDLDEQAYLADFGIAKDLSPNDLATAAGVMIGSPAHMAPEQIRTELITPQTDIYSLGIVLYEMLAGEPPFPNATPAELVQHQISTPLPVLRARRPELPAALDLVVQRATAKQPSLRYPTVHDLLAALHTALLLPSSPPTHDLVATADPPAALLPSRPVAGLVTSVLELGESDNPYQGLRAFYEADARRFYGREALTQRLIERMAETRGPARFLAVVGPSGSGKSSVVRAGLLPALRRGALPGSEHWFICEILPGVHPLEEIESALLRIAVNPPPSLIEQLRADPRGLVRAVKRTLPPTEDTELVLVIDQFEELFTLVEREDERVLLLESLTAALRDPRSRLRVIITLRADFYDRPLHYPGFSELIRLRTEAITPLNDDELRQAISEPARQIGLLVEPALIDAIVRDVGQQPGALPLVQYALTELYTQRVGRTLTFMAYQQIGGISGALARRADAIYAALDPAEQQVARQLLLRLITLGAGNEDTRRRALITEFVDQANGQLLPTATTQRVLEHFAAARMLTFDHDPLTHQATVEVAHEALIRSWDQLRTWVEESRAELLVHRRLTAAALEWMTGHHDPSYLASGGRLVEFERLRHSEVVALDTHEQAFLKASIAAHDQQIAAEQAIQRQLRENLAYSEAQRLAAEANQMLITGGNAEVIALLALTSMRLRYTPQGDKALAGAAYLEYPRVILPYSGAGVDCARDGQSYVVAFGDIVILFDRTTGNELRRFDTPGDTARAVISPDGRLVLTSGFDGNAALWDVQTGAVRHHLIGHTSQVLGLAFAPDGVQALTCSFDGSARLWDVVTGVCVRIFNDPQGIYDVAFAPDGCRIATGGYDQIARILDVATGEEIQRLVGHTGLIMSVAFSINGQLLLTTSYDSTARIWDCPSGIELRRLQSQTFSSVTDGLFLDHDTHCLTSGHDGAVRLWDVATGAELRRFVGHNAFVFQIAITPDERDMFTVSGVGPVRIWNLRPEPYLPVLIGHRSAVLARFISDSAIVTTSFDMTGRIWNAATGIESMRLSDSVGETESLAVSPDRSQLLTGSNDGLIRLWDLATGQLLRSFSGHTNGIRALAFSPDGRLAISGGYDARVYIWDIATGQAIHHFTQHRNNIFGVAFSPDGILAVSGSVDDTTRIWCVADGQQVGQIERGVASVIFTPDGNTIITGDWGGMIKLWEAETGAHIRDIPGHTTTVWALRCSLDGRFLFSASGDKTARMWELATGRELRHFAGHRGDVLTIDISPDQRYVLTGSADGTARRWDIDYHNTMRYLESRLLRDFNDHERTQYGIPDLSEGDLTA